jgi:uncharacterized protein YndB with AHSA1/START domain
MTTANTSTQPITLRVSRTFDAPRERVFQAWTDPTQLKKWFHPEESIATVSVKVDLRVGGKYRIQMKHPDGEFYTGVGSYREVKPPERLVFTWAWEKDGSEDDFGEVEPCETIMTLEFHARGKQTELVLTHENFSSTESRDRHEHGWNGCLDSLVKFVQQKPV